MATTLRLPPALEEQLDHYCESVGAAKSRVTVLALKQYLGETAPALPLQPPDVPVEEAA